MPKLAQKIYSDDRTHSQFNIFQALRREPRGQKPPNKVYQASEWGRPDPQNKPWEDHQGVSGFFLKAAQNTVLGYHFLGFSRGL
jgi:hypothetical protein